MEKLLLTNPEIIPERQVFESALKDAFPAFEKLFSTFSEKREDLLHEWRYYNDYKAWLCKVQFKKKTIFWLSVWEAYFKITFYFSEEHLDEFFNLPIDVSIKELLNQSRPSGKLIPLVLTIRDSEPLDDVQHIVNFKKKTLLGNK
ncbi:MAG: DUF3788 family protein [Bacteroidales bacterium]